ncbi:MAG: hypothetical protein NUV94_05340 [Candidatus Acetothermia bacterium]|nr:hypothetical protein [Candidatus Acetothermia bacterium]
MELLFERARLTSHPELSATTCTEIARVYLETGDAEMALFWMERIPHGDRFDAVERDRLLYAIHERLGACS